MTTARQVSSPRLTEDEVERGLAVVAKLEALQAEELAERGGVPLPDSVEIIHSMREERTGDLLTHSTSLLPGNGVLPSGQPIDAC